MMVESVDGDTAVVSAAGTRREACVSLLESVAEGDFVLVHAGFAIRVIDKGEAEETARLLNELAEHTRNGNR